MPASRLGVLILLALPLTVADGASTVGGDLPGGTWLLLEVTQSERIDATLSLAQADGPGMIGIFAYDLQGNTLPSITGWRNSGVWVVAGASGEMMRVEPSGNGGAAQGILHLTVEPVDGFRLLLMATGGVLASTYTLDAAEPENIRMVAMGNRTFYAKTPDAGALVVGAKAYAVANVERSATSSFKIDGRFVGAVPRVVEVGEERVTWETPSGTKLCWCSSSDLYRGNVHGPGHYVVTRDATKAGTISYPFVAGADVILPS